MRFSTVAVTLLGAVASASASSLLSRQLPNCAASCLANANFGSCMPTDNLCLCKSDSFISSATTCIEGACTGADLQAALTAAQQLCAAVGVTLTGTPTASGSAPASTATSPAASGSSKPAASGSASGSAATSPAASSKAASSAPAASSTGASGAASGACSLGVNALLGMGAVAVVALAL